MYVGLVCRASLPIRLHLLDIDHILISLFFIQNSFALIRARGGHNPHPTVDQAKAAVRALACNQILRPLHQSANCEPDPAHPPDNTSVMTETNDSLSIPPNHISHQHQESLPSHPEISIDFRQTDIYDQKDVVEEEILNYVHGSIIRRFVSCCACVKNMSANEVNNLIKNKTISGCRMICPKLVPAITHIRNFVFLSLPSIGHLQNISSTLKTECEKLFDINFHFAHKQCAIALFDVLLLEIVKFFVRVYCKRRNEKMKNDTCKTKSAVKRWTRSTV